MTTKPQTVNTPHPQTPRSDPYPEHQKLQAISEQSQTCGEFLDWLTQQGIHLCSIPADYNHTYFPISRDWQSLLAEFFDIDLNVIEAEKRQMLDRIRAAS